MNLFEKRKKKDYIRPFMVVDEFSPSEYVSACFTYEANLVCDYGRAYPGRGSFDPNGLQHGAPCANSYVRVTITNGNVEYAGHEGAYKPFIPLESVDIPNIENLTEGSSITGAKWESSDGGATYLHKGNGQVTSWTMTKPGHPNHS